MYVFIYTYDCMGSAQVHTSVYRMCTHPPLSGAIFLRGALGGDIVPTGCTYACNMSLRKRSLIGNDTAKRYDFEVILRY